VWVERRKGGGKEEKERVERVGLMEGCGLVWMEDVGAVF